MIAENGIPSKSLMSCTSSIKRNMDSLCSMEDRICKKLTLKTNDSLEGYHSILKKNIPIHDGTIRKDRNGVEIKTECLKAYRISFRDDIIHKPVYEVMEYEVPSKESPKKSKIACQSCIII